MMDKKIQIGEIVEHSKKLEAMLKKLEAEGRGMHELISSIEDKLEPELKNKLRFIATIRNKAIHEPEFDVDGDFEAFCTACEEASQELEKIVKPKRKKRAAAKKTEPGEAGFNYLFLLPFIPGLNIIYFLFILILSVLSSMKYVIILMLYLFSFAAAAEGIIKNNQEYIIIGGAIFAVLYICNFFVKSRHFARLRYVPLLNIILIIENIKDKIYWKLFFIANIFIIMSIVSVFLAFYRDRPAAGALVFSAAYIGGIILFIAAGKRLRSKAGN